MTVLGTIGIVLSTLVVIAVLGAGFNWCVDQLLESMKH